MTLARIYGIAEPPGTAELDYLHGLREAVSAAIDFAIEVLSRGDNSPPDLPTALLMQARLAARNGVALDVVLRRYFSGYTLFANLVFEEGQKAATSEGLGTTGLLRSKTSQFDRLVGAITEEYQREVEATVRAAPEFQARLVERLLAGEVVDAASLAYDVHRSWHLAMVVSDHEDAAEALRAIAEALDCRLLHVRRRTGPSWAWLGRRGSLEPARAQAKIEGAVKRLPIAIGHPARGLAGWRLSHRQARAIYPLVQRSGREVTSYAEAGLVAAMAKDEVLIASLRQIYIEPLHCGRDDGEALKETARAYLAAGRNITSAASALRLNRQTVRTRLRTVEDKLGRSLDECGAEMEIALRLERELGVDADLAFLAESG
jgi:PucR C-terminal helix-turn-helix domain/GGDEF-like domain